MPQSKPHRSTDRIETQRQMRRERNGNAPGVRSKQAHFALGFVDRERPQNRSLSLLKRAVGRSLFRVLQCTNMHWIRVWGHQCTQSAVNSSIRRLQCTLGPELRLESGLPHPSNSSNSRQTTFYLESAYLSGLGSLQKFLRSP